MSSEQDAIQIFLDRLYPTERSLAVIDDYAPTLKDIFLDPVDPRDPELTLLTLVTPAGSCINIPTTCRLPEQFIHWGNKKEYWAWTRLDGRTISSTVLLESLQNGEIPEEEDVLNAILVPMEYPSPDKIKRTSMQLYGYIITCANAWRMFYKMRLRSQLGNSGKFRAAANLIGPLFIILVFMLIVGLEAIQ